MNHSNTTSILLNFRQHSVLERRERVTTTDKPITRAALRVILLTSLASLPLQAQFIKLNLGGGTNKVPVAIMHAPSIGLTAKRLAFGQPVGPCADELLDRKVLPEFTKDTDIDVIDRQHLDQILAEHNFNQSVYADPASAAKLGKILGPSALIIVKTYSCQPDQQHLIDSAKALNGAIVNTYISRTRVSLEGSINFVDLTTGKVLGTHDIRAAQEQQNNSQQGYPEFPPIDVVKDLALNQAATQVHSMFFPYEEIAELAFYDDNDCGLKEAYQLLKRGDKDGSLKLSETNLEQCKADRKKGKTLPRAYYDAGLSYCIHGDYGKARDLFSEAMQTKGAEAVTEASAACNRAEAGAAAVKSYNDRLAQIPAPSAITSVAEAVPGSPPGAPPSPPSAKETGNTPASNPPAQPSVEERLKKLDSLRKKGLISQKDYEAKKADILKEL